MEDIAGMGSPIKVSRGAKIACPKEKPLRRMEGKGAKGIAC